MMRKCLVNEMLKLNMVVNAIVYSFRKMNALSLME